jgi:hypothetical protein
VITERFFGFRAASSIVFLPTTSKNLWKNLWKAVENLMKKECGIHSPLFCRPTLTSLDPTCHVWRLYGYGAKD